MLKYNFAAIDGLCGDMQSRVATLASLKGDLENGIKALGAQWEGNTAEAMTVAFASLTNDINELGALITGVKAAVDAGNSDMGATDSFLSTHWHPGAAV